MNHEALDIGNGRRDHNSAPAAPVRRRRHGGGPAEYRVSKDPCVSAGGDLSVENPVRHLQRWCDVVKRLHTPFGPGRMGRERRVIDAESTWDGIDTRVDIIREHRHGSEGIRRGQAPGRDHE